MLSDKELSEFCKAAALLFDNGYSGPARALLGSVLMHPSLDQPAKESQEEGSSEDDPKPNPRLCYQCGGRLGPNNKSGICNPCYRANRSGRAKRPCATPGCEIPIRSDNRSGMCANCYALSRRQPWQDKPRPVRQPKERQCRKCGKDFLDDSYHRNRRLCVECGGAPTWRNNGKYNGVTAGSGSRPDPWRAKEHWQKALNTDAHQMKELDEGLLAAGWTWDAELDRWRMGDAHVGSGEGAAV